MWITLGLVEALKGSRNVCILGDFNTPSRLTMDLGDEHRGVGELLDKLNGQRDAWALRHFLPRERPRIGREFTALGFAERLGYRHLWRSKRP